LPLEEFAMILDHVPNPANPCDSPDAPCRHFRRKNMLVRSTARAVRYPSHVGSTSIKCAFGGAEVYETGSGRFAIDDSSYLILNSGQNYASTVDQSFAVHSFCVFFRDGFLEQLLRDLITPDDQLLDGHEARGSLTFFERTYTHDGRLSALLRRLAESMDESGPDTENLDEPFHDLGVALLAMHRQILPEVAKVPAAKASTRTELYRRLHRARDYMEACSSEPLKLDRLAEVACLSSHHFLRLFRSTFGSTPHEYLTRKRIHQASQLLRATELPVTRICFDVGFESPASFSLLFRRRTGLSPQQYRAAKNSKIR
jgi:AraC family transcriptional regulator